MLVKLLYFIVVYHDIDQFEIPIPSIIKQVCDYKQVLNSSSKTFNSLRN